jgi:hypothetical protein
MEVTLAPPHHAADVQDELAAGRLRRGCRAGSATAPESPGVAAQQLSTDDVGLQLLENSIATVLGLTILILPTGSPRRAAQRARS